MTNDATLDRLLRELNTIAALIRLESENPEAYNRIMEAYRAQRAARRARREARWQAALDSITDKAEAFVSMYEREGAKVNSLFKSRVSGNVAVMMVKENVWNHKKGRMGRKLIMVYPDGARAETLEKSISVRKDF